MKSDNLENIVQEICEETKEKVLSPKILEYSLKNDEENTKNKNPKIR